jgi:hypothetical protein
MEAIAPQRQNEILARYQQMRTMGKRLIHQVVEMLDGDAIDAAARQLGMLKKGVIVFNTEDETSVLMDYAIHHVRQNKRTVLERFLSETPPSDNEELAWLQASQKAHYRILRIEDVFPGFGLQVYDPFRDERHALVDVNLSRTAQPGLGMATHVFLYDDFWMTTGAGLPVTGEVFKILTAEVTRRFGKQPQNHRHLSPARETELATMAIRICMAEGMSQRVAYGDVKSGPHF